MKTITLKKQFPFRRAKFLFLSLLLTIPAWVQGQNWKTAGNNAMSTDFLGTTNVQDLRIRTSGTQKAVITTTGNLGIGTASPAARLDVIGQVKITDGSQGAGKVLTSDANGLASWQTPVLPPSGWGLSGNAGTSDATNFIGTTDNIPLNFRVNNQMAGRIDQLLFNTYFGYRSGYSNTSGNFNTASGSQALYSNTTGFYNSATGGNCLYSNSTGHDNTAAGFLALYNNFSGNYNIANGGSALYSNSTGSYNTASGLSALLNNDSGSQNSAVGLGALATNVTGNNNTALGYGADVGSGGLTNATAIGANTMVGTSNSLVLGNGANVGIGTSTPVFTLDVQGNTLITGKFVNLAPSIDNVAVAGQCLNTPNFGIGVSGIGGRVGVIGEAYLPGAGNRYGLFGNANSGNGENYGAFVNGSGGTIAYGIRASANGGTTNWAGYFDGNIYSSGKLAIGISPTNATVDVSSTDGITGRFVSTVPNLTNYALVGSSVTTPGYGTGVRGDGGELGVYGWGVMPGSGNRYGLRGNGWNGTNYNYGALVYGLGGVASYGIYAGADGGTTNWAGYFEGNVYTTGTYTSSDRILKQNIQPLGDALSIINRLNPSVYTFKTDEYKQMHLPEGLQYGLIADEVQQVIPGAVKKAIQPAKYENNDEHNGKKLSDEVAFSAVNYTEIIPILVAAVKEQQEVIEKLSARVEELQANPAGLLNSNETGSTNRKTQSVELTGMNSAFLSQNTPNPFSTETSIGYYIPETQFCNNGNCHIVFYDQLGRIIYEAAIAESGFGILNVSTKNLSAGVFTYKLLVNNEIIDTKRMVFSK